MNSPVPAGKLAIAIVREACTMIPAVSAASVALITSKIGGATVGAQLWYQHAEVAYGHVLAFSPLGYEIGAPYALYWFALENFLGKVRWCSIGGVSGTEAAGSEGLSQFKRGWSTATLTR